MELLAFAAPILPGKTEEGKRFVGELNGARRNEYVSSRRKLNVRERAYLQETPHGDLVIVTLEGDKPEEFFRHFTSASDPFSKWFIERVRDIHGMDLTQMASMPFPKKWLDTQEARAVGH